MESSDSVLRKRRNHGTSLTSDAAAHANEGRTPSVSSKGRDDYKISAIPSYVQPHSALLLLENRANVSKKAIFAGGPQTFVSKVDKHHSTSRLVQPVRRVFVPSVTNQCCSHTESAGVICHGKIQRNVLKNMSGFECGGGGGDTESPKSKQDSVMSKMGELANKQSYSKSEGGVRQTNETGDDIVSEEADFTSRKEDDTTSVSKAVTEQQELEQDEAKDVRFYYLWLFALSAAALYMRLFSIEVPAHICWDETHFGKMASWYINRTFFFDVHPPLGKMMIGLAGYLTGYDGSFPFAKPGDEYGDTEYIGMRIFCAVLGSALVPMSFQIVWLLSHSVRAALFAATFILFDTGTATLSRYILLDPPLLFFIMLSVYCNLKFLSFRNRSFSLCWWFWMICTGVSLSGAIGVKFVGLFVILLVGLWTAVDLNNLFADPKLPLSQVIKHLIARAVCLIALPAVCYVGYFYIHFAVLSHSGSGDGFFSSAFQSQLEGNKLYNVSMPQYVAFGSVITLKQRRTGGAYLHSHPHLYPEEHGPRQQQVTTYSHKDENNLWKVKPADQDVTSEEQPPILVKSGDLIRLEHVVTRRNLHSHKEPAPLSKRHYQVSGYGVNGSGDANDVWLLEIVGDAQGTPVQTVRSQIKLVHYYVRCALFSHDKKLPKWGWEQLEATCNTNVRDQRGQWSVEEVRDWRLPNVSFELYSPSFVEKFMESHAVMTQGNSGLKPKEGEITSRPWQWPINYRGQIFSGKDHRVYLLGNPVLFWAAVGLKVVFLICYTVHAVKRKRRIQIHPAVAAYNDKVFTVAWWLLLGWALHYVPFWGMGRVLYFHHYFPAFLFSAMFCGVMLDYLVTHLCLWVPDGLTALAFFWCLGLIMGTILFSFYLFYPLTYGMHGNPPSAEGGQMHHLRWLDSWDF